MLLFDQLPVLHPLLPTQSLRFHLLVEFGPGLIVVDIHQLRVRLMLLNLHILRRLCRLLYQLALPESLARIAPQLRLLLLFLLIF